MTSTHNVGASAGGGFSFLGMSGSAGYFWNVADGLWEHVGALLQALEWPAFLIDDVFVALNA